MKELERDALAPTPELTSNEAQEPPISATPKGQGTGQKDGADATAIRQALPSPPVPVKRTGNVWTRVGPASIVGAVIAATSTLIGHASQWGLHVREVRCVPGRRLACQDDNAIDGTQTCNADGQAWGPCIAFRTRAPPLAGTAPPVLATTQASMTTVASGGEKGPQPPPDDTTAHRQIVAQRTAMLRGYGTLLDTPTEEEMRSFANLFPRGYTTIRVAVDQGDGTARSSVPLNRFDHAKHVASLSGRYTSLRVTFGESVFQRRTPSMIVHRYAQRFQALNGGAVVYEDCGTKGVTYIWSGYAWQPYREWEEDVGLCA